MANLISSLSPKLNAYAIASQVDFGGWDCTFVATVRDPAFKGELIRDSSLELRLMFGVCKKDLRLSAASIGRTDQFLWISIIEQAGMFLFM